MIELCFFSLDQWEIKIHLLWGKCFNIPHWPRSHSTNRRLQHIEKLSKTYSGDPHLDQTKLNGLLLLTIHGVLVYFYLDYKCIFLGSRGGRFDCVGRLWPAGCHSYIEQFTSIGKAPILIFSLSKDCNICKIPYIGYIPKTCFWLLLSIF